MLTIRTSVARCLRKPRSGVPLILLMLGVAGCAPAPTLLTPALPTAPPPAADVREIPQPVSAELKTRLPAIAYTIQAGVFSTVERAQLFSEQLITKGLEAYYFMDQDGYYKVRFERYGTKEAAAERAAALRVDGLLEEYYIVQPQAPPVTDQRAGLQDELVATARKFIGVPYRWGGISTQNGFDCSGLTMTVYRLHGMELPRSAAEQFKAGDPVKHDALEPGDLVFFSIGKSKRIDHVGIYSGAGRFIHAPGRGKRVNQTALMQNYFKARFKGARRYF